MANSDQFLEWNSNEFMYSMVADDVDGGMFPLEIQPILSGVLLN